MSLSNAPAPTAAGEGITSTEEEYGGFLFTNPLRLSTLLRFNHACSFLQYATGLVLWVVCLISFSQDPFAREVDFYMSTGDGGPAPEMETEPQFTTGAWLDCPLQHSADYVTVGDGATGFCASTIGLDGSATTTPLLGCDVNISSFVSPPSWAASVAYCEDLCHCADAVADCLGFSVLHNATFTMCRLHTADSSCAAVLPPSAATTIAEATPAGSGLSFARSSNTAGGWSADVLGIHHVDGTPDVRCYAQHGSCNSDCLGLTCDELSAELGLSCECVLCNGCQRTRMVDVAVQERRACPRPFSAHRC